MPRLLLHSALALLSALLPVVLLPFTLEALSQGAAVRRGPLRRAWATAAIVGVLGLMALAAVNTVAAPTGAPS